ncbi:MAG TPA: hypothetical protein ENK55_00405 [Actinobacteria bacterium]|nr:hypothetical protein [Actinomycetota bacterium]
MRRRHFVVALVALGAFALGLGLAIGVVGQRMRTPAQVVADAQPPAPSPVTADVERRVLAPTVVVRGEIVTVGADALILPLRSEGPSVVTGLGTGVGEMVREGDLLAEVAGRPVFVVQGSFPFYRDLVGGVEGPDVRQLQESLTRMGWDLEVDGVYGQETQRAVGAWYARAGYEAALGASDEELSQARDAYLAARDQATAADEQLAAAQAALQVAIDAGDPVDDLQRQVANAQRALAAAKRTRARAWSRYREVRLRHGPSVPRSEVVVVDSLPREVAAVEVTVGEDLAVGNGSSEGAGDVTLAGGTRQVVASIGREVAPTIEAGDPATGYDDVTGTSYPLEVVGIDEESEGPRVVLVPIAGEVPQLTGRTLRVVIAPEGTGEAALVVPVTAVWTLPDGATSVTVLEADGTTRDVVVVTGTIVDGFVAIEPVGGTVAEGDQVVVGYSGYGTTPEGG